MSTLDIFPMQKRCQMNNLWSLFAVKYSFLSLPAFPKGRIVYRRALWRNLCSRKQTSVYLYPQYVSILGMKKFHLDENMQIYWIKQIDGIEVEQSNLNFQTSLIIWVALPRFIIKWKKGENWISYHFLRWIFSQRYPFPLEARGMAGSPFGEKLIISLIYSYSDILRSLHTKGCIRWITNIKIARDFVSSTNINWWSN